MNLYIGSVLTDLSLLLSSADLFCNQLFRKILSGIPSECQIGSRLSPTKLGPMLCRALGPICLQRLLTDVTSR